MERLVRVGRCTNWVALLAVVSAVCVLPAGALARSGSGFTRNEIDWTYAGDFNLHIGQSYLDDSEWGPVEDQLRFGIEVDFTNSSNWAGLAFGFFYSNEDESIGMGGNKTEIDTEFLELDVGLRKVFYNMRYVRPFVGIGGALYSVDVERNSGNGNDSDNDMGYGGYAEVGLYIDVYGSFHLGANVRYGVGRVDLFDSRKDPAGLSVMATIGTHWVDY